MGLLLLQPWHVGLILMCTVCLTTTLYFFSPPKSIARGKVSKPGPLGPPDAEFDWCEVNFESYSFVAEPWNSATSVVYILLYPIALSLHDAFENGLPARLHLLLFFVATIGVGSVLFHGTLRYSEQLLDELPMYWLICAASSSFWGRKRKNAAMSRVDYIAVLWGTLLTAVVLLTERDTPIHTFMRGMLTCSFSIQIVTSFYMGCACGAEVDSMLKKYDDTHIDGALSCDGSVLFAVGFWSFLASVVVWVVDILFCSSLQALYVYPNLHSAWHVLSAYGVYCLLALILANMALLHGIKIKIVWKGGLLPAVIRA
eukprot:m.167127 g.167127  ORF g.167127 m.167127 type:complete len:314 (-) comp18184_c0_seq4:255-1196(-)